ncbi:hypothetical protein ACWCQZ_35535 [Streptomyces sp. NPDC002285]
MEAHAGERDLIFLDESGFTPTMPTGYTYSCIGQRAVAPREDTKNPRVNVLGAQIVGTTPDLLWQVTCGKIDAGMLLEFVCADLAGLPGGGRSPEIGRRRPRWTAARLGTLAAVHRGAGQRLSEPEPLTRHPVPRKNSTMMLTQASCRTAHDRAAGQLPALRTRR